MGSSKQTSKISKSVPKPKRSKQKNASYKAAAVVPSLGTTETAIAVMPSVGRLVAVVMAVKRFVVTTDKEGITNPINVTVMDVVVMPNETNIGVATVVMPNLTPGPTTGVVMVVDTATDTAAADTAAVTADTAAVTADTATVTVTRVAERRTTGGRRSNTPAKESRPSPFSIAQGRSIDPEEHTGLVRWASLFCLIPFVVYKNTHIITDSPYHTHSS